MNKTCNTCKIEKPKFEFYKAKTTKDRLETYCKICSGIKTAKWKKDNIERSNERDYLYNTSERGFIINTIATLFLNTRGNKPNITKPEVWEELILHIEKKKEEFPGTDGRLCDYCDEPWTYIRRHPDEDKTVWVKNPYNFSIDRLDNDITYQKGNIIFCHSLCNDIKHSVTIKMCERILKLHKMKKVDSA